jgi:hypothetical protein
MRLQLKMITSTREFESRALKSLMKLIDPRIKEIASRVQETAQDLLKVSLESSPEYISLTGGGRLRTELGVVNPEIALVPLTQALVNSVSVTYKGSSIKNSQISASLRLVAAPKNLGERVKSLGVYTTRKGSTIRWLDWLLNYGDQIIVRDYDVDFSAPLFSRTGGAIMAGAGSVFGNTKANSDGGWSVPSEYSGTEGNNFMTRSIDAVTPKLEQFMIQSFKKI